MKLLNWLRSIFSTDCKCEVLSEPVETTPVEETVEVNKVVDVVTLVPEVAPAKVETVAKPKPKKTKVAKTEKKDAAVTGGSTKPVASKDELKKTSKKPAKKTSKKPVKKENA